ncbi:MAG: hypothetical protein Q9224_006598 [Gallowayella concinna]
MARHLIFDDQSFPENTDGEFMVAMELGQQWTADVPKPSADNTIQAAIEKYGLAPRAKPDMNHGYNAYAFPGPLLNRLRLLPRDLHVSFGFDPPWMPWQTTQWTSTNGQQAKAEQQAKRAASTSIECLHRFFKHESPTGDPEPLTSDTCVFSLQVYNMYCHYRVHWRRVDENGKVSYEGDILCSAFVNDEEQIYRVRSCMLNILDWARGTRLPAIHRKLEALAY